MKATLLTIAFALVPFAAAAQSTDATLILINGKIFTGEPGQFVEAVAIAGDKIAEIGSSEVIRRRVRTGTRVINLGGRTAIAGINDAHLHPGDALTAFSPDLGFDPNWSQVASALAGAVDETAADVLILITVGPTIINDPNVTRATIDAVAPNRKVLLKAFTGHGMVMSSAAMTALGVADNTPDPPGGFFGRDANGNVNGRAFEYAQYAIDRKLFDSVSDAELLRNVSDFGITLTSFGITSIQAMPQVDEERFIKAWTLARVPVRLRVMEFPFKVDEPLQARTSGVKWILDGTPIERGAALRTTKYGDDSQGRLNFDNIRPLLAVAVNNNQQLLVHAAGDKTVELVLRTLASRDALLKRPRLEHGDGLQSDLFDVAQKLGVVVVQNPTHFPFRDAYPKGEYMLAKTLVQNRIPLAFGSDGPINPFLGIMNAVDRGGREELTREQAVIAYTSMSAFAEFQEEKKGKILPGMLADIAVLSQDIFTVPLGTLPDTTSVLTIINGVVVHSQL